MTDDSSRPTDPDSHADDPADSVDLTHPERVRIGVTRGESDLEVGPPRDYPDGADVSVHPERAERGDRIVLSVDAMAGDHGTGHADVELTAAEARIVGGKLAAAAESLERAGADDASDDSSSSSH